MRLIDLADLLVDTAKEFVRTEEWKQLLLKLEGTTLTSAEAIQLVSAFQTRVKASPDIHVLIGKRSLEWCMDAPASVLRNEHMNDAPKDLHMCEATARAALTDFINVAVRPIDLALYASDLG